MQENESQENEGSATQPSLEELFAFEATVNANIAREAEERERAEVMARFGLTDSKSKKSKPAPEPDLPTPPTPTPPAPTAEGTPNPFAG